MSVFIVTVAALSTVVLLCAASTLPRADAADVSVADFADAVRRSSACRDNTLRVRRRAQKWARFYDALLNDGRFESYKQGSSTIDCVAFELQPALVEASHTNDADTLVAAQKMRWRRRHLDSNAQPSGACGVHRVPVVRPVVDSPFGACPRLRAGVPVKSKPHRRRRQGAHMPAKSSGKWNGYSYEYVDSPFEQMINMTSSWATFALSSALGLPIPYVPADNTSHAINQLWWTTTANLAPTTVSLGCGWIRSNYFTNDTQTTLFAFSTPDAYSNQSSNGPDSYNLAGGFVQYPGSPALGAAMNEVMMALEYRVLPDNMGFELWYRFFDARRGAQSSFDNVTWTSKDWLPFGFYPMARYHWGVPQFDFFQVGSESCIADGATVQASGSILQWGQDGQCYPLANQFFGEGDYSATYVGESWTHGTPNNSTVAVVFNGTNF